MAYMLTLDAEERKTFDWVGCRYSCGYRASSTLLRCYMTDSWDSGRPVTFTIPEHIAWELLDIFKEDTEGGHNMFPCFTPKLKEKLYKFCDNII